MSHTLFYIADPMCSWCYGFAPQWALVQEGLGRLPHPPATRLVMGGLAPDSDRPMDDATRAYVQQAWHAVAAASGAEFNHQFWTRCRPRRSTYPACRAVLVAEHLQPGAGPNMFGAIQRAYYREARNPSDTDTLCDLAVEIDLPDDFPQVLASPLSDQLLQQDLEQARRLGATGFPTLVLEQGGRTTVLSRGFDHARNILERIPAELRGP